MPHCNITCFFRCQVRASFQKGRCPCSDVVCPLSAIGYLPISPSQEMCLNLPHISFTLSPCKPHPKFNCSHSLLPSVQATQHCFSFLGVLKICMYNTSTSTFSCGYFQVAYFIEIGDLVHPFIFFSYSKNTQKSRIHNNIF